jgi:hypothetical protein
MTPPEWTVFGTDTELKIRDSNGHTIGDINVTGDGSACVTLDSFDVTCADDDEAPVPEKGLKEALIGVKEQLRAALAFLEEVSHG